MHQRLAAVMANANGDALEVKGGPHVVRMETGDVERNHARALSRILGPEHHHPLGLEQSPGLVSESVLMRADRVEPDRRQIIERGTEGDLVGEVGRARLEFVRQRVPRRFLERDTRDHVSAA